MLLIEVLKKIFTFIPRKYSRFKQEQQAKRIAEKYGNLTKYNLRDSRAEIGDFTYGVPLICAYCIDWKLSIGKFCSISNNVQIVFGGQHHYNHISQYAFNPQVQKLFPDFIYADKPSKPVIIGNDVWIGRNVTILQGVNIGDGAVLGTNTVVAKDVPPYAIVVGNPARIIKYRFKEHEIESLRRIAWWDWPLDKIQSEIKLIMSDNIEGFIRKYDKER